MKVQMKAIVTYTWEEDTEKWDDEVARPKTKEELLNIIQGYVEDDYSYITCSDPDSIEVKIVE